MAEEKDPLKITLREASQLYNQEVGVSKTKDKRRNSVIPAQDDQHRGGT